MLNRWKAYFLINFKVERQWVLEINDQCNFLFFPYPFLCDQGLNFIQDVCFYLYFPSRSEDIIHESLKYLSD